MKRGMVTARIPNPHIPRHGRSLFIPVRGQDNFDSDADLSRAISLCYQEMLKGSAEHRGSLTVRFLTPAQIKEGDRFTAAPSFRGLISRLLFRANALAEFYGSGMLYDNEQVLALLGACRSISIVKANTEEIRAERYFHKQRMKKQNLPPFFAGVEIFVEA